MKNKVQLITYVDRFGGQTLTELRELLIGPLKDVFGGVHLLPFFYKIDGADAGFDPIDHTRVDDRLAQLSSTATPQPCSAIWRRLGSSVQECI